ncbi:SDR family NAD(P)-dependent oxidoreductase [Arthrobacter sp. GCM10027362]|uniref:SDR family NAD(P)-dependent oxidoreductase n=1 Tax=Arthrobacter sp. GCM10027362 TaxID=3273379 RepID=UPI00362C9648
MKAQQTANGRLADKVVLITGAGSGLGQASALRFAEEGALVACVDLSESTVAVTADKIIGAGGQAIALGADVSSAKDAERMTAATIKAFGQVDVVFANAGIGGPGNAMDLEEDVWDRVIDVDLKGVWLSSKFALRNMVARGSGTILNTASIGGLVGVRGIFPYAAAKGGVIAMTKQLVVDFGPKGIRANAICPGTVPTPLVTDTYVARVKAAGSTNIEADAQAGLDEMAKKYPAGRLGRVEDVAALALFLASDESSWITGQAINVDGGYTAA